MVLRETRRERSSSPACWSALPILLRWAIRMGGWVCATAPSNNSPATGRRNCAPLTGPPRLPRPSGANGSGRSWRNSTSAAQPVRYETEYVRKDGTRVPLELLVHLVKDAEGRPEYYYSFLTDITGRKRAEEATRLLSGAVEAAANGIAITDREERSSGSTRRSRNSPATPRRSGGRYTRALKSGRHPPEFYRRCGTRSCAARSGTAN